MVTLQGTLGFKGEFEAREEGRDGPIGGCLEVFPPFLNNKKEVKKP